ncbi:MAG: sodium/proline symporter [Candidatus Krumholzibacteria bacterium]|jgi:sodium/proline symporter|nr:sodium/proline symporter [Candidatus Krumholzibacteria bacterium]MDP6668591.1 sodium/proline symporter [Candidatus Krumholzibacteria bacterium]
MSPLILSFSLYLGIVLLIGIFSARKASSQREFLLGGRELPGWAIAISERASGESSWLLLGLTGAALTVGLGEIWTVLGCVAGILFLWFRLGGSIRAELEGSDALTVPELLAQRFGDPGHLLRWTASLVIIFFFSFYVAAQMVGAGKILMKTGIVSEIWPAFLAQETWGIVLGAMIVMLYTLLGGFRAVVWTDLLQGFIMILALVLLPLVGYWELQEKHGDIASALKALGPEKASWTGGESGWAAWSLILGGLSWGLGYMGQPHLLVRFMALPRASEVRKLRWLAGVWTLLAYGGAFAIGLLGLGLLGAESFAGDAEKIMPMLATRLFPAWIAGIVISGAVAAMMSTADSQLLVTCSAFSEDIAERILGLNLSASAQVMLSRIVVLLVGGAAFALALSSGDTVYSMVSYAWSGLGSSFGPVILLMVFWKGIRRNGALASLLTGTFATILWKNSLLDTLISHRFSAFALALLAGVIFSKLPGRD